MPADEGSNPLDRTSDMEGLSAAERAKIYKERAAAAGIGQPPAAGGEPPPARQPAAAEPAAPRPAEPAKPAAQAPRPAPVPRAAAAQDGDPLARTSEMEGLSASERARLYKERAAAAGIGRPPSAEGAPPEAAPQPAPTTPAAAARPAPAAARPAAAGTLTAEQRERLVAAAQRTAAPAAPPKPTEQAEKLVYVWPHLVTIEFMAAVLMLVSMIVISIILQAPLEGHANTDKTPNPSKAPWYFLNLQELLLHMHPALAGVLVPAGALTLIAMIPFFDRNTRDAGKWFGTPNAVRIAVFTSWYTALILAALILFDELVGVKPLMAGLARTTGISFLAADVMVNVVVPVMFMSAPIVAVLALINRRYRPVTARDLMICLFTGFVVSYVVLTISGTFFRGQGMHLYWPWDSHMIRVE